MTLNFVRAFTISASEASSPLRSKYTLDFSGMGGGSVSGNPLLLCPAAHSTLLTNSRWKFGSRIYGCARQTRG